MGSKKTSLEHQLRAATSKNIALEDVVMAGQRQALEVSRSCCCANTASHEHLDVCTVARLTMQFRPTVACYFKQCCHSREIDLTSTCCEFFEGVVFVSVLLRVTLLDHALPLLHCPSSVQAAPPRVSKSVVCRTGRLSLLIEQLC